LYFIELLQDPRRVGYPSQQLSTPLLAYQSETQKEEGRGRGQEESIGEKRKEGQKVADKVWVTGTNSEERFYQALNGHGAQDGKYGETWRS